MWFPGKGRSLAGEEARHHPLGPGTVAAAEEVEVVEHVVQVIELASYPVARVDRPHFAVALVEACREAAEELGHREVGFRVAVVNGRIEHGRRAVGEESRVAAPEIAVQQRRCRRVPGEQLRYRVD